MSKEPVLLVVLIETQELRWYVAGVLLDGTPLPLLRSEAGNLSKYLGAVPDEQVSFLRHRLSGVLQRGCDRLWARQKKPCQIAFVCDRRFDQAPPEVTQQVADHFAQWMVNPPAVFYLCGEGFGAGQPSLEKIAGEINPAQEDALEASLVPLCAALSQPELWETSFQPQRAD